VTWVQLITVKNIDVAGKQVHYKPGDWVDVGKHLALRWAAQGEAKLPEADLSQFIDSDSTGVLLTGNEDVGRLMLKPFKNKLGVSHSGLPKLPWPKTLIYNPNVQLRTEMVPVGFAMLDVWQVACPMYDYETLACHIGETADQQRTLDLIHDTRIPLLNPGMVFIKRCADTEFLIDCWVEESVDSTNALHAFTRAVYRAKPLILTLPATWTNRDLDLGKEVKG